MTSLLDAEVYTHEELAGLYRARCHMHLYTVSIKYMMKMDMLRCKTPEMVHKEI